MTELVTHHKRGGLYRVVGTGRVQCDYELIDMMEVVIYRGEDGQYWVRPPDEFDQRFRTVGGTDD